MGGGAARPVPLGSPPTGGPHRWMVPDPDRRKAPGNRIPPTGRLTSTSPDPLPTVGATCDAVRGVDGPDPSRSPRGRPSLQGGVTVTAPMIALLVIGVLTVATLAGLAVRLPRLRRWRRHRRWNGYHRRPPRIF